MHRENVGDMYAPYHIDAEMPPLLAHLKRLPAQNDFMTLDEALLAALDDANNNHDDNEMTINAPAGPEVDNMVVDDTHTGDSGSREDSLFAPAEDNIPRTQPKPTLPQPQSHLPLPRHTIRRLQPPQVIETTVNNDQEMSPSTPEADNSVHIGDEPMIDNLTAGESSSLEAPPSESQGDDDGHESDSSLTTAQGSIILETNALDRRKGKRKADDAPLPQRSLPARSARESAAKKVRERKCPRSVTALMYGDSPSRTGIPEGDIQPSGTWIPEGDVQPSGTTIPDGEIVNFHSQVKESDSCIFCPNSRAGPISKSGFRSRWF